MDADKFKNDLILGETSSVEFKRCGNEVEHDVFESICAFLNRFGGDVYLGVLNDGTVVGGERQQCRCDDEEHCQRRWQSQCLQAFAVYRGRFVRVGRQDGHSRPCASQRRRSFLSWRHL